MKNIQVLAFLMLSLHSISMYTAQESQHNVDLGRQAMIDNSVKNLTYLTQGFDFLQTQNLVDTSFHDFLKQHVSHDEDGNEDMNFDQVIVYAEDVLTKNMKDTFFNTLDTAIKEDKNLSQLDDPLFLYVMKHKDTTLRDIVRLWLLEWSKVQDEDGRTPLHWTTRHNSIEIAGMLITAGADLNIQDKYGDTPLHLAAFYNNRTEVTRILNVAVFYYHIEIARMLIDACADLNIQNNDGNTPLHLAAFKDSIEIARMLIGASANLIIQDKNGRTAEQLCRTPEMRVIFTPGNVVSYCTIS